MSPKKLGRGLDTLIQRNESAAPESAPQALRLDPRLISVNRSQPRAAFDDESLAELAASIRRNGILQPLVVRIHESGGYELVAGERRLRAALKLSLSDVPVVVQSVDPENLLEIALVENIQREDLNPIELAQAYQELQEQRGWTQAQLAEHLGKSRSSIANAVRFLELDESIQMGLAAGEITPGHAKVLLSVEDSAERRNLFQRVRKDKLSVRALEAAIAGPEAATEEEHAPTPPARPSGAKRGGSGTSKKGNPPHIEEQEALLARTLGTKVEIREKKGRGKIVIEFYTPEDYERVRRRILVGPQS